MNGDATSSAAKFEAESESSSKHVKMLRAAELGVSQSVMTEGRGRRRKVNKGSSGIRMDYRLGSLCPGQRTGEYFSS